jgi:hypothetical protein
VNIFLIIQQGGWLLGEHSTRFKLFFLFPEFKSLCQITHIVTFKIVTKINPWTEMDDKVGHFLCKLLMLLAVALLLRRASAI